MPLTAGDKLGRYEIFAPTRRVFDQEVHSIAALNHPNICQILDIGPDYLVLELRPALCVWKKL
jgi:hypothetical protein